MEHRSPGIPDFFQNSLDRYVIHRRRQKSVVFGGVIPFQFLGFNIPTLKIDGNIHPHRPGPAGRSQMPRFFQGKANLLRIFDHHGVLGHGCDRSDNIVLLIAHGPKRRFRKRQRIAGGGVITHLSAYDKHGNRVQPAAYNAGQGIGPSGACGHADSGDPVVQTGIGLRRHGAGLFMVIISHMQLGMMAQRIVQMHGPSAYHAENICYAPRRQKIGHIVRQSLLHKNAFPHLPCR